MPVLGSSGPSKTRGVGLLVVAEQARFQRLGQFRPVAAFGMLIVLEIAPEMKGCTAAIIRMWLSATSIFGPRAPGRFLLARPR
jgi:hypothetical protein